MCNGQVGCSCRNRWPVLLEDYGVEIKCIYPTEYKAPVMYECPKWYVMQVLAEMAVLHCKKLLLCYYSMLSMVVIECEFDEALWLHIWSRVKSYLDKERPQLLQKIRDITSEIGAELELFCRVNTRAIGEFPSVVAVRSTPVAVVDTALPFYPYHCGSSAHLLSSRKQHLRFDKKDMDTTISTVINEFKGNCAEGTNFLRNEATDIVVFVISDSQRLHRPGIPPHIPVAYAMKSPSLSTDIMHKMLKDVRRACRDNNASIMCEITDGEFLKIANSTSDGHPLTLLQRLKWRYKFFDKHSKQQLLDIIILRINPPYNYPWYQVKTVNSKGILPTFLRKLADRNKNRKVVDTHERMNLNLDERIELLEGTKLCRKLKMQKNREEALESTNLMHSNTLRISTTYNDIQDSHEQTGGIGSHSDEHAQTSENDDDSDNDFIPSDYESHSDDDINAAIGNGEENYTVDFPGKPNDFDNALSLSELHPCIIAILQRLQHSRYQVKWNNYDVHSFVNEYLSSSHGISSLKHIEMNIIQSEVYKFFGKKIFNVSALKAVKVQQLVRQFCPTYLHCLPHPHTTEAITISGGTALHSLWECAKRKIMAVDYPKDFLKIVVCQMTNEEDLTEWLNALPVATVIDIPEANIEHKIFCYPFFNESTLELECRTLDPSHILNNLRSQICRHGFTGVATSAFHDVSNENNKLISRITLADQMDKQKVSVSKQFFCEDVEKILQNLGHTSEAAFVKIVRNWYAACDERGIHPLKRLEYLQAMQSHLLGRFDYYNSYPPPTRYIQGITVQMFEAILITVSTRFILYSISDIGHYNHRAISTLGIESFFSELTRMEFSGLGTPKSSDIPKLISHIVQLNQVKHDPDQGFEFTLTKDSVYPYYMMDEVDENAHPYFQNWFDEVRKRKKREKWSTLGDPFKQDRGVCGVRPNFYRIDESKILMENRCPHAMIFEDTLNKI